MHMLCCCASLLPAGMMAACEEVKADAQLCSTEHANGSTDILIIITPMLYCWVYPWCVPAGMVAAWEEAKAKADREAEWRAEWIRKQMQEADRKEQQDGREGGAQ